MTKPTKQPTQKDQQEPQFDDVLKRMLKSPPKQHKKESDGPKEHK